MDYKIQYLKLGGVLDQAISIVKNNFGLLFGIMLCTIVPLQLIQGFVQLSMFSGLAVGASEVETATVEFQQSSSVMIAQSVALGFTVLLALVVMPLSNASVIHAVARAYLGKKTTILEAIKLGFSSLLGLIATAILYFLAVFGGMILLIIPGILCMIWFCMYQHVVVIEKTYAVAALKRSKQILSGNYLTLIAMGFILMVISVALAMVAAFIPQPHVSLIATVLIQAIVTILGTAAFVVFYFSCRCKNENFDLQYLAESIGMEAPADETGDADEAGDEGFATAET